MNAEIIQEVRLEWQLEGRAEHLRVDHEELQRARQIKQLLGNQLEQEPGIPIEHQLEYQVKIQPNDVLEQEPKGQSESPPEQQREPLHEHQPRTQVGHHQEDQPEHQLEDQVGYHQEDQQDCLIKEDCQAEDERGCLARTPATRRPSSARNPVADRPYKCTECGKVFPRANFLLSHLLAHISAALHRCSLCGIVFGSRSELQQHACRRAESLACSLCPRVFDSERGLRLHVIWAHCEREVLACTVCGREFKQTMSLRNHVWKHHVGDADGVVSEPIKCKKQPKPTKVDSLGCAPNELLLTERGDVETHKFTVVKAAAKSVVTQGAGKPASGLHVRLLDVDGGSKRALNYSHTAALLKQRNHLTNHVIKHTRKYIPPLSKLLSKTPCFSDSTKGLKASWSVAKNRLPGEQERSESSERSRSTKSAVIYPCRVCFREYTSRSGLVYHEKVHRHGQNYFCHFCNRTYESSEDLSYHLTRVHGFAKAHSRPGSSWAGSGGLRVGEQPQAERGEFYRCHLCARAFDKRCYLGSHTRAVHGVGLDVSTLRPTKTELEALADNTCSAAKQKFACLICRMKFSLADLHVHMVIVHKIKLLQAASTQKEVVRKRPPLLSFENLKGRPYACEKCPWRFKQSNHLLSHTLSVHLKVFKRVATPGCMCVVCMIKFPDMMSLYTHAKNVHDLS